MYSYMASRSRRARAETSTRYAIFRAHVFENLLQWLGAAICDIVQPLADGFVLVGEGGEIEQMLVGGGVLEDGAGLAVDGEDDGAAGTLELAHHADGVVAEGCQRLDVFGDFETAGHGSSLEVFYRTFLHWPYPASSGGK